MPTVGNTNYSLIPPAILQQLQDANSKGEPLNCPSYVRPKHTKSLNYLCYFVLPNYRSLIMSNSNTQFVSENFAHFLLDNANNGNEILAVLDDLYEVQSSPL